MFIQGTPGNDNGIDNPIIFGTLEDDDIYALEGHDTVYAGAGNDYVDGWEGDDWLWGGTSSNPDFNTGNDILVAWSGNDLLHGGDGHDWLDGSYDNDILSGGSGNDTLGNSYLQGEDGHDQMSGGEGNDELYGGEGNDTLNGYIATFNNNNGGSSDLDTLMGGNGADKFILGQQTNSHFGGKAYYLGSGYATIIDFQPLEGDKFQVYGMTSDYELKNDISMFGNLGLLDTRILYKNDLIAVVQDTTDVSWTRDFNP